MGVTRICLVILEKSPSFYSYGGNIHHQQEFIPNHTNLFGTIPTPIKYKNFEVDLHRPVLNKNPSINSTLELSIIILLFLIKSASLAIH